MQTVDDVLIRVQREWNGWHTAEVRFGDLQDIHWRQPRLGPRPLAHAYISCTTLASGALPHGCEPGEDPHRLLVCVLKKHCIPSVYAEIARRADAHQTMPKASDDATASARALLVRTGVNECSYRERSLKTRADDDQPSRIGVSATPAASRAGRRYRPAP